MLSHMINFPYDCSVSLRKIHNELYTKVFQLCIYKLPKFILTIRMEDQLVIYLLAHTLFTENIS